ncbi:MAG: YggT family protein [Candidatus Nanopelagicales bacterium]|jgi:YggT family protein|nr:YggT family protein [Candidatus Nanopelagicales bacterium]
MTGAAQIVASVLWLYWLILIARLVLDLVQVFARGWRPRGFVLVLAEAIYSVTDPPLRLIRRVLPPIRLGQVQFDLAFLVLLVGLQILINILLAL